MSCLIGCATPDLPGVPAAGPAARQAPEDQDLLAVVPAEAEVLLALDIEALRDSAWTRPVLVAGAAGRRPRGYDELADVDRVLMVRLPGDATGTSLAIAQGRFDRDAVRDALPAPVVTAEFRGCLLWTAGGETTAFLTERTLLTGELASVRAAIDAAWGRARDIRAQSWLGELRRRFGKDLPPAAVELAVRVSEPMRDRLREELEEAAGLERVGARIELGRRLNVALVGTTGDRDQAVALMSRVGATLRDLQGRPSLVALGLGPVLAAVQLADQGPRVAAELRLRERDRDEIARRLSSVARLLAARGAATSETRP